jgi:hypothetical protein
VRKALVIILAVFAVPLGLLTLVCLVVSLRPHSAAPICVKKEIRSVTLYQSTYLDLEFPWAMRCTKRYIDNG